MVRRLDADVGDPQELGRHPPLNPSAPRQVHHRREPPRYQLAAHLGQDIAGRQLPIERHGLVAERPGPLRLHGLQSSALASHMNGNCIFSCGASAQVFVRFFFLSSLSFHNEAGQTGK